MNQQKMQGFQNNNFLPDPRAFGNNHGPNQNMNPLLNAPRRPHLPPRIINPVRLQALRGRNNRPHAPRPLPNGLRRVLDFDAVFNNDNDNGIQNAGIQNFENENAAGVERLNLNE